MKPTQPAARSKEAKEDLTGEAGVQEAVLEAELVERARARDQDAFRQLVEMHRHSAYGVALRILRQSEEAEDVAQEAFVRAWTALPRFRGDSKFSTWLHRIAARRALDRLAVLKRRQGHEVAVESAETLPAESGEEAADVFQRSRQMERLIAELPEAQRIVITLFYFQERSVIEVADTLGMPQGTVKTHLSRARAVLRKAWLREGGQHESV